MDALLQQLIFFGLNFFTILAGLLFYAIFGWVICSWLIMFGIMTPSNRAYGFLGQMVQPVLAPFRWAKIGMIDLSPIMAILVLDLVMTILRDVLERFVA